MKQYRGVITLGASPSLELLLLAACLFSGGDWFLLASAGVLGLGAAFLPGALRELPRPLGEHKAVLYLGTETLLLCALLWSAAPMTAQIGSHSYPAGGSLRPDLPWAWVLICRYAPISRWWKGTACLGAACVFSPGQPGDRPAGAAGRRDGGAAPRLLVPTGFHPMGGELVLQ